MNNVTYFDRCIDLTLYDNSGRVMQTIRTPKWGPKPDITVKGMVVAGDTGIDTEVAITNFSSISSVSDVSYVGIDMYYGQNNISSLMSHQKIICSVLYADDSKQPPDRQVLLHCTAANSFINIMTKAYENKTADAAKPTEVLLSSLLSDWIKAYNDAVNAEKWSAEFKSMVRLASLPKILADETVYAKTKLMATQSTGSLGQYLDDLNEALAEPTEIDGIEVAGGSMYCVVSAGQLLVLPTTSAQSASKSAYNKAGIGVRTMNYVASAFRNGSTLNFKCLWQPDLQTFTPFRIATNLVLGKSVAGHMISVPSGFVTTSILPGMTWQFGTITGGNYMQGQAILPISAYEDAEKLQ